MKYLLLIYIEANKLERSLASECLAYAASLAESGQCLAAEALQARRIPTIVRVRDGNPSVTDGPFVESKELLAGFYLLDVEDLDQAIELASGIPPASLGRVEIRPVLQTTPGGKRETPAAEGVEVT